MASRQAYPRMSTGTHVCTPICLIMALRTIASVAPLVGLVSMAASTAPEIHVQILRRVGMAFLTSHLLVFTHQFVARQIVVESLEIDLLPVILRMAGEAIAAQSIQVGIFMTGTAFSIQPEIGPGSPGALQIMALVAIRRSVGPFQSPTGDRMVEALSLPVGPGDQRMATPLMFRVTCPAFPVGVDLSVQPL